MSQPSPRALTSGLILALAAVALPAHAGGFLGIPTTIDGYPANVGLLIVGHSTSGQGQYPTKLAAALNDPRNALDGRHYLPLTAITGGDGGLLWSLLSVGPADARYDRATASAGVGETNQPAVVRGRDRGPLVLPTGQGRARADRELPRPSLGRLRGRQRRRLLPRRRQPCLHVV